jgi:hypothetical protein
MLPFLDFELQVGALFKKDGINFQECAVALQRLADSGVWTQNGVSSIPALLHAVDAAVSSLHSRHDTQGDPCAFLGRVISAMDSAPQDLSIPVLERLLSTSSDDCRGDIGSNAAAKLCALGDGGIRALFRNLDGYEQSARNSALALAGEFRFSPTGELTGEIAVVVKDDDSVLKKLMDALFKMLAEGNWGVVGMGNRPISDAAMSAFRQIGRGSYAYLLNAVAGGGDGYRGWAIGNSAQLLAEMRPDGALEALLEGYKFSSGQTAYDIRSAVASLASRDDIRVTEAIVKAYFDGREDEFASEPLEHHVEHFGEIAIPLLLRADRPDHQDKTLRIIRRLKASQSVVDTVLDPGNAQKVRLFAMECLALLSGEQVAETIVKCATEATEADATIRAAAAEYLDGDDEAQLTVLQMMAERDSNDAVRRLAKEKLEQYV